ncbi:glutaminase A [Pseudactinotalea sp. Z1732]|uniref:glutaminase A n=1 Tax=Micrococcales TaxID=85006 RepID=UPI003C7BF941
MESPIDVYLRRVHAEISEVREGTPYTVGPRGTTINPDDFGICLATVDGYIYEVGVTSKAFSMQSLSKPFSYGLALSDLGPEVVDEKVDVEPSGESFTEISLAPGSGRPANAMINAGALAVSSLLKGAGGKSAITRIEEHYSAFAGRELRSNARIYGAERRNSDRNHALAYLLSSVDIIEGSPTAALETYLRQCAVQITCRDLAMMAATLANGGTNPRTEEEVLDIGAVERVLSVMMTSGMYDSAGDWVVNVGMPAKSGVGGGTLAVLPGQAGLAVFSPPLDEHGNSIRGVATCQRLSRDTDMHFVRSARAGRSAIRATYPITEVPSDVRRTEDAEVGLRETGERAMIIELAGDLLFAGTESMIREIADLPGDVEFVVLDARRVDEVSRMSVNLLGEVIDLFEAAGRRLVLIDPDANLTSVLPVDHLPGGQVPVFSTRSTAVAHCEEQLLRRHFPDLAVPARVPVRDSPAMAQMSPQDAEALVTRMESRTYDDGAVLRRIGQRFGGVYFIVSGTVTTTARDPEGNQVRLTTLSAGMTFGELSLGRQDRQRTTQRAVGPVEVMVLTDEAIADLEHSDPRLAVELWRSLTREAYTRVDQYMREVTALVRD